MGLLAGGGGGGWGDDYDDYDPSPPSDEGIFELCLHLKNAHTEFRAGTNPWGAGGKRFYCDSSDDDEYTDRYFLSLGVFVTTTSTPTGIWGSVGWC